MRHHAPSPIIRSTLPPAVWLVAAAALLPLAAAPAGAQGARGAGPDAQTPAARSVRIGFGGAWDRTPEAYDRGALREMGARFTFDTLGRAVFPVLGTMEAAARVAAGDPGFTASLGKSVVHARRSVETQPITLEWGVTNRIAAWATIPFVASAVRVDARLNPSGREATVGLNPALATPEIAAANGTLLSQLDAAGAYVSGRMAACQSAPTSAGCGPILANPGTAAALVAEAAAFTNALATIYGGRNGSPGAPFIPLAGGAAQAAVVARLAGLRSQFTAFGAPAVSASAPIGAPAPLTAAAFTGVLTDTAFGIASSGLVPLIRRGLGNVEAGFTVRWHDSRPSDDAIEASPRARWWRSAVSGSFSLGASGGSGTAALIGAPLGERASAMRARLVTEAGLGGRYAMAAAVSGTLRSGFTMDARLPTSADDVFPAADRAVRLGVTPGAEFGADFAPRWSPASAMSVAMVYAYRHRAADTYSVSTSIAAPAAFVPETGLGAAGTSSTVHRVGFSVAYSTLPGWRAGRAKWPIEVAFSHYQTLSGSGDYVPKTSHDAVTLSWYWRARRP